MHRIVDAIWTSKVNILVIECTPGKTFEHRADRWRAYCPYCHETVHLTQLRENYRMQQLRSMYPPPREEA